MSTPHRCWVILVGNVPTSFRAKEREDLVPTFKQLQRTQPEVTLRWFERGRVWENPDAARAASLLAAEAARFSDHVGHLLGGAHRRGGFQQHEIAGAQHRRNGTSCSQHAGTPASSTTS